jgi:hypothetical protein
MGFDWKGFVDVARHLVTQAKGSDNPEAFLRSAMSRAYFGAFCHARNYAVNYLQFSKRDDQDDHGRLRAFLQQKRRTGDAARLERLRQWRNQADYVDDLSALDLPNTVATAIIEADRVFSSLAPPKK